MPIYEYQCRSCGQVTEILQKISDGPLKKCPECNGKVSKLMSMNSFQLKGTGWYVTDYAGKKDNGCAVKKSEKTDKVADSTPETPATSTKKDE